MYTTNNGLWMPDMGTHQRTMQQITSSTALNGTKDARHKTTRQNSMQNHKTKDWGYRCHKPHNKTEVEVGRTRGKIHRQ